MIVLRALRGVHELEAHATLADVIAEFLQATAHEQKL